MLKKRCAICGKDILVKESNARRGWGKYCSKQCQFKGQIRGEWVKCDYCGKKIWRTPKDFKRSKSGKFFCSVGCHCAWENENSRSGENAPNWIAGQTVSRRLLKRCGKPEKCARCGNKDTRVLAVHHRDGNRRNNCVENLQWLCRNCHCIVHLNEKNAVAIV